jgi:hypothetical protein
MQDLREDHVFIYGTNNRIRNYSSTVLYYCLYTKQMMRVRTTVITVISIRVCSKNLFLHQIIYPLNSSQPERRSSFGSHFCPTLLLLAVVLLYFEIQHCVSSKINFCSISSSSRLPSGIAIHSNYI